MDESRAARNAYEGFDRSDYVHSSDACEFAGSIDFTTDAYNLGCALNQFHHGLFSGPGLMTPQLAETLTILYLDTLALGL